MLLVVGVALVAVAGMGSASASPAVQATTPAQAFHPTFRVLDADGKNVLESGLPMSTMQTCGVCHDTEYIEQHSFHADLGLSDFSDASLELARPWDQSRGMFGKWDPLTYRYLSPTDSDQIDLTTVDWLKLYGARIPGGGPATTARDGTPLTELAASAENPETSFVDPVTGELAVWDWKKSGTVEMDCVLCHTVMPDTAARTEAIQTGDFGWATTASLLTTGIVTKTDAGYTWVESAFDENGELKSGMLQIQDPSNENCSQCHGVVHTDAQTPLLLDACDQSMPQTATTGQVIASQKINESAINPGIRAVWRAPGISMPNAVSSVQTATMR
ncbi:MAG: hypothetical protein IPK16_17155 [Anaerolineales bacterium]|nr:hypothetical protein [Anaerolineales bacterium]